MFKLDKEINDWCDKMRASGYLAEAEIDELKDHLYCEIEQQQNNGLSIDQALTIALDKLGSASALSKAYSKYRNNPIEKYQLIGGHIMKPSKVNFDLYLICTVLFGWILFTWITFLEKSLSSNDGLQPVLISMLYLVAIGSALVASAVRKPLPLLATSIISFILLSIFMLGGEYWWFWTELNTVLSFLCVLVSVYLYKHRRIETT